MCRTTMAAILVALLLVDNATTGDAERLPTNANATGGTAANEESISFGALTDVLWRALLMPSSLSRGGRVAGVKNKNTARSKGFTFFHTRPSS